MGRGYLAAFFLLCMLPASVRTLHYSFWSDDPRPYRDAIEKAGAAAPPHFVPHERVCAGIVTHHFLASALMVRFFSTLSASAAPDTIVLIGPNHFHRGLANISLSSLPWKTPFGMMETDRSIIQQFQAATQLPEDPEPFAGEHSVGVLIPFLRYYFPRCRVVPVLVDVNARARDLKQLRGPLADLLRHPRVLVVLSMDFSHDAAASVADTRDGKSEQVIANLDSSQVEGLQVDCRKGLWLLLAALGDVGGITVHIGEHTNSARLTGNARQPDVTSYFTVYFTADTSAR
jgi:hypothetical protein